MKNYWSMKQLGIVLLCAVMVSACSSNNSVTTSTATTSTATTATAEAASDVTVQTSDAGSGEQLASIDPTQEVEYDEDDAYTDWTSANPTEIKLNGTSASIDGAGAEAKDSTITITSAGTYAVSGILDDGQIVIDVKDEGTVRLVLNGAEIHNSSTSPIYVEEAGKTIITLQEGTENLVSDGATYVYPDAAADESSDEPNSAIFSKDDLTINGTGKLVVQGNYNNGITSKDKLKITGGTLEIHAVDDGLMGRDLVAVQEGELTIEAGGDAIKTTYDTDATKGFIVITGGTINIDAGDDGIHSETAIAIAGGTIDIVKSNEGIEAPTIVISDGKTSVVASDDGMNVAGGDGESANEGGPGGGQFATASTNKLTISGGYLSVESQGDGLDSNGSIVMTGGTVVVNGPTGNNNGSLDYDGTFEMTGGVIVSAGSSGMVQAASDQSTQYGILMTYSQAQQAGTLIHLEDSEGNAIITFAPSKDYQAVYISSPNMKKDASYTLYSGGTSTGSESNGLLDGGEYQGGTKVVEFKTSTIVTWLNESGVTEASSGMGGPGGRGGGGRMRPQRMQ